MFENNAELRAETQARTISSCCCRYCCCCAAGLGGTPANGGAARGEQKGACAREARQVVAGRPTCSVAWMHSLVEFEPVFPITRLKPEGPRGQR